MPQSTPNLSLVTYDLTLDAGVYFSTFRSTLAGYTNSALTKIDTWAGQVNADLTALKQSPSIIRVSATKDSDFIYSATVLNMPQYSLNQYINLSLDSDNVGTVSLNINALGGKSLLKFNNAGTLVNISAKDLRQGKNNLFTYNGTAWVWVNAISSDQLNIAGTSGNLVKISADNTLEDSGATFSNSVTNNAIVQRTATGQIKGATASANDDVVNKLYADTIDNKIGLLSALETVDKTNVVGAINENFGHIGDLSTLTTTDKSNLVRATNELNSAIGQLSNPNLLINGDFQVWQRSTSLDVINGSVAFSADRWLVVNTLGLTGSVRTRKLTAISGGESLVLENLGSGSGSAIISQGLEELDVNKLRGKRVTLSYFFNTKMSDIGVVTYARFSETQAIQANGVGANVFLKNDTGSTTWKKVTQTFDVPVNAKGLAIGIYPQFLANRIGDFLQIRDVKLEVGEMATPLSPRGYGEELALCQRYCKPLLGRYAFTFYDANNIYFCANELLGMRTTPVVIGVPVEGNANDFILYNSQGISQTGFVFSLIPTALRLSKNLHGLTNAGLAVLKPILLDAEIY